MFFIIYRSTAYPAIGLHQIRDLLDRARDYNRANDITGCLLYHNNEFVQYLEGDEPLVAKLFDKIRTDRRHTDVVPLYSGHINGREFENWSMAYGKPTGPDHRPGHPGLLVSSYFGNAGTYKNADPATKKFWVAVRTLLAARAVEKLK